MYIEICESSCTGVSGKEVLSAYVQGTVVTAGRAKAVVISTGSSTAIGQIRCSLVHPFSPISHPGPSLPLSQLALSSKLQSYEDLQCTLPLVCSRFIDPAIGTLPFQMEVQIELSICYMFNRTICLIL